MFTALGRLMSARNCRALVFSARSLHREVIDRMARYAVRRICTRRTAPSRSDLIDNEFAEELWTASLEGEVRSGSLIRDGRGLERGDDQL